MTKALNLALQGALTLAQGGEALVLKEKSLAQEGEVLHCKEKL